MAKKLIIKTPITDGNNNNYSLNLPDSTSWLEDKTIATTDQVNLKVDCFEVRSDDNVLSFINTKNINDKPIIIQLYRSTSYIGKFNVTTSTTASISFIGLDNIDVIRVYGLNIANKTFYDIFKSGLYTDNYEREANRVTSISSSSTEWEYPSAKCVYDNLELKADKNELNNYAHLINDETLTIAEVYEEVGDASFIFHYNQEPYLIEISKANKFDLTVITPTAYFVSSCDGSETLEYAIRNPHVLYFYETQNNKVTSLSSSSTDTEYPSAKAVVDYVDENDQILSNNICAPYDNTATYEVNDIAMYNNQLVRCTVAITEPEEFNPEHWTASTIKYNFVTKNGDQRITGDKVFDGNVTFNGGLAYTGTGSIIMNPSYLGVNNSEIQTSNTSVEIGTGTNKTYKNRLPSTFYSTVGLKGNTTVDADLKFSDKMSINNEGNLYLANGSAWSVNIDSNKKIRYAKDSGQLDLRYGSFRLTNDYKIFWGDATKNSIKGNDSALHLMINNSDKLDIRNDYSTFFNDLRVNSMGTNNKSVATKEYVDNHHDSTKQDILVSGTNIKTINNESILGSGNINIQGGGMSKVATITLSCTTTETAKTPNSTTGTIDYTKPMIIQISPNQNITARAIYGGQYNGDPYFYCRASDVTTVTFDVYQ